MDENTMQAVIMNWAMERKHHEVALPNLRGLFWGWEADVISVTKAWLVHEFEIKVDKYDLRADTRKWRKHHYMEGLFQDQPGGLEKGFHTPNYFWYATSWELDEDDLHNLPDYAGWMRVEWYEPRQSYAVRVEKEAPRLHGNKLPNKKRLSCARWLSYKLKNMYRDMYLKGGIR